MQIIQSIVRQNATVYHFYQLKSRDFYEKSK